MDHHGIWRIWGDGTTAYDWAPLFLPVFWGQIAPPPQKKNTSQNKMRGQNAKRLGMQLKLTFAKTEEKYNIYIYI